MMQLQHDERLANEDVALVLGEEELCPLFYWSCCGYLEAILCEPEEVREWRIRWTCCDRVASGSRDCINKCFRWMLVYIHPMLLWGWLLMDALSQVDAKLWSGVFVPLYFRHYQIYTIYTSPQYTSSTYISLLKEECIKNEVGFVIYT
jgi:hypothetical protein